MASFPGQKSTGGPLPSPPVNLTVGTPTASTVPLSWSAPIDGALSYNVYRNAIQIVSGLTLTTFTDSGLVANTAYTYYVTAVNNLGEGLRSNAVNPTTLPGSPTALAAGTPTVTTVPLSWSAPAGGASSYNLYRNGLKVVTGILGTSYTDTGLTASTTYAYQVTAQNPTGESLASNTAGATTQSSGVQMKWFPGIYMGSNHVITRNQTIASIQTEVDACAAADPAGCFGYRMFVTISHLDPNDANGVQANYNFTVLRAVAAAIFPKKLDLQINFGRFNTSTKERPTTVNDNGEIPTYMLSNSAYGAGLPTGTDPNVTPNAPTTSGYWAQNTGGFGGRLDNALFQDRMTKLMNALAIEIDNNIQYGGVVVCEDSNLIPYQGISANTFMNSFIALMHIVRNAFQNTPAIAQSTFQVSVDQSATVSSDMVANGILQGTADTYGASYHGNKFTASISGNVMTVSATQLPSGVTVGSPRNTISINDVVDDITGNLASGTKITALGTGTGGAGTYIVSPSQIVASETMFSLNPASVNYGGLNWGLSLYVGKNPGVATPTPDLRGQSAAFLDRQTANVDQIRSLDVQDLVLMLNTGYRASKCYFGFLLNQTGASAWTNWNAALVAKFKANPITNTAYPPFLPQ